MAQVLVQRFEPTYQLGVSSPIVGIDLGTTYSAVGQYKAGRHVFFENELGEILTPSAVAYDEGSRGLVCGRIAKEIFARHPELAAHAFKRDMGLKKKCKLGPHELSPVELSAYLLDRLRADAERALGCSVMRAVVSVPAYFDETQRAATKEAAELAGLTVERIINEPTAAALAYGLEGGRDESSFLILDLGGGTFDVSIVEIFEGILQVKSVAGESRLGGEDFTLALLLLLCERAGVDPEKAQAASPEAWSLAFKRAELLKRKLSRWPSAEVRLPPFSGLSDECRLEIRASEADATYRSLLDRLRGPCRSALRGAGLAPEDIDEIALVGGATRLPCIKEFAREMFGREPRADSDPDYVVARGAAIQAALIAEEQGVEDVIVTDVAAHSLGLAVSREVAGQELEGRFSPVLHRNTVIPASRQEVFHPVSIHQKKLELQIYEGEARNVADNRHIGTLTVKDLPRHGKRGVAVRFTYDLNGLLEVEATVLATGSQVSALFERSTGRLGEEEMSRARARLQQLKADPAARPRYRDLLSRAGSLWADLSPRAQDDLSLLIDRFEVELSGRNPVSIEAAYQELFDHCKRFDQGERY